MRPGLRAIGVPPPPPVALAGERVGPPRRPLAPPQDRRWLRCGPGVRAPKPAACFQTSNAQQNWPGPYFWVRCGSCPRGFVVSVLGQQGFRAPSFFSPSAPFHIHIGVTSFFRIKLPKKMIILIILDDTCGVITDRGLIPQGWTSEHFPAGQVASFGIRQIFRFGKGAHNAILAAWRSYPPPLLLPPPPYSPWTLADGRFSWPRLSFSLCGNSLSLPPSLYCPGVVCVLLWCLLQVSWCTPGCEASSWPSHFSRGPGPQALSTA